MSQINDCISYIHYQGEQNIHCTSQYILTTHQIGELLKFNFLWKEITEIKEFRTLTLFTNNSKGFQGGEES